MGKIIAIAVALGAFLYFSLSVEDEVSDDEEYINRDNSNKAPPEAEGLYLYLLKLMEKTNIDERFFSIDEENIIVLTPPTYISQSNITITHYIEYSDIDFYSNNKKITLRADTYYDITKTGERDVLFENTKCPHAIGDFNKEVKWIQELFNSTRYFCEYLVETNDGCFEEVSDDCLNKEERSIYKLEIENVYL